MSEHEGSPTGRVPPVYLFTSGHIHALKYEHYDRRFVVMEVDEFKRLTQTKSEWSEQSADEVYAEIESRLVRWQEKHPEIAAYWREYRPSQSGPPPVIPIPHRVPELASDEVPRVVAKARAVAIFGPKRGRWK